MQTFKSLLLFHGLYLLLMAIGPLVELQVFMSLTESKTDPWPLEVISLSMLIVSICLLSQYLAYSCNWEFVVTVCIASSAGVASLDFYYALSGLIPGFYLIDGGIQILLAGAWFYMLLGKLQRPGI